MNKEDILKYLITEERKLMFKPSRFTRAQRPVAKSYVRFIMKFRIQGWIQELREIRKEGENQ